MRILIAYSTHGGVSRRCAQMLATHLEDTHTVTLVDVRQEPMPTLDEYDVAVLGSSVRMGSIDKSLKKYIRENCDKLSNMPSAVFICCGFTRLFEEYTETQLPSCLECSLGYHLFGGELKPDKLKGFDKFMVKMARSSIKSQDFEESDRDHHDLPEIIPENIILLAKEIKKLAQ